MQRNILWAIALCATLNCTLRAQEVDITGNWQGTEYLTEDYALRSVVKVTRVDGKLQATLYSIDQVAWPIPLTSIDVQGSIVTYTIKSTDTSFKGRLAPDGATIVGQEIEPGGTYPLTYKHVTPEETWFIPDPDKPMPASANPTLDEIVINPSDPNAPDQSQFWAFRHGHLVIANMTLNDLISVAYEIHPKQIVDAPYWADTDKFDVDANPDRPGLPSHAQFLQLIRSLLSQRFGLTLHLDKREIPVYALTVVERVPNLTVTDPPSAFSHFNLRGKVGELLVGNLTMEEFCLDMQGRAATDRPIVDRTGLAGNYDFKVSWAPDTIPGAPQPASNDPKAQSTLWTALKQQLGLEFEDTMAVTGVLVVDHVERP